MEAALRKELNSLLAYYGENPDSPEAPKPEDFFGLIASFSSSLQVCKPFFQPFLTCHISYMYP
jgi:diaphanous 1